MGGATSGCRRGSPADNSARRRAAWRQLAEQFGAPRAAYIADVHAADRIPTAAPDDSAGRERWTATFRLSRILKRRPAMGGHARRTRACSRIRDGSRSATPAASDSRPRGAAVPDPLAIGPTLDEIAGGFDAENMAQDPNAAWLVDFDAAERAGMALRIRVQLRLHGRRSSGCWCLG